VGNSADSKVDFGIKRKGLGVRVVVVDKLRKQLVQTRHRHNTHLGPGSLDSRSKACSERRKALRNLKVELSASPRHPAALNRASLRCKEEKELYRYTDACVSLFTIFIFYMIGTELEVSKRLLDLAISIAECQRLDCTFLRRGHSGKRGTFQSLFFFFKKKQLITVRI